MDVEAEGSVSPQGLTSAEAEVLLRQYGPNAVRETKPHPLLAFAREFWAPVPWMLEVTIVLELVLGKRTGAIVIGVLLVFNAVLGFVQQNRAQNALDLLRRRLPVTARVLRGGEWQLLPAENLVPGDFIHVRLGDVVPVMCGSPTDTSKSTNPHSLVNPCLSKRVPAELHLPGR